MLWLKRCWGKDEGGGCKIFFTRPCTYCFGVTRQQIQQTNIKQNTSQKIQNKNSNATYNMQWLLLPWWLAIYPGFSIFCWHVKIIQIIQFKFLRRDLADLPLSLPNPLLVDLLPVGDGVRFSIFSLNRGVLNKVPFGFNPSLTYAWCKHSASLSTLSSKSWIAPSSNLLQKN